MEVSMRTRLRVIVLLLLWLVPWPSTAQTMRAHFLDVGQGSAAILETECAAVLVDTGGELNNEFDSTQHLLDQVDEFFFGRPDLDKTFALFVLSHPHIDHTRGVRAIVERYKILNVVTNGQEASSGKAGQKTLHRHVAQSEEAGDPIGFQPIRVDELPGDGLTNEVTSPIACGSVRPTIRALWGTADTSGWSAKDAQNQNNHSVVMRVDFAGGSMLLTGDLEERGIAGLLERYRATRLLEVDVYVVGHHGAANATTDALLKAVSPRIAVISMGSPDRETSWTAWAHGHPRKVIVQKLVPNVTGLRPRTIVTVATGQHAFQKMALSKAIYATGWDGPIVLEVDAAGHWKHVKDEPPFPLSSTRRHPVARPVAPSKLDLNSASADELDALPLIGLSRARRIVAFRTANGPFRTVEELLSVPGIGMGTLKAVRPLVTLR